ncbi:unnamed protein product [marine sediment metagenome]|uniref:Uncharacterized protein n=1 Tax=marine sediment metagenome TaxID=412755 RepID=X1ARM8_9ZZZZ
MKSLIFCSYAISGGFIFASNRTSYHPQNEVLGTFYDMLKVDTSYGETVSLVNFVLAPALVPVYTVTLPLLCGLEYINSKFEPDKNKKYD